MTSIWLQHPHTCQQMQYSKHPSSALSLEQCSVFLHIIFFFLGYGRCRTVARSLHEHKQSKRHLHKDPEGPKVQANHNKPKKNHTRHQDDPQIPQPDLRFVKNKNSKPDTQRGKMQKVPQPSKPTWVSVQDVVLNSLRPSTQPSQLLPELSHFYQTHKHRKMSSSCRYGSCWCVTPWHKMMRSRQLTCFCQLHKSDHKNTCPHKKSLHQDMVCLFK